MSNVCSDSDRFINVSHNQSPRHRRRYGLVCLWSPAPSYDITDLSVIVITVVLASVISIVKVNIGTVSGVCWVTSLAIRASVGM